MVHELESFLKDLDEPGESSPDDKDTETDGGGERRAIKYNCIWCGFPLPPGKRRFHNKCRRENDKLRASLGTNAPGGNVCANPYCSEPTKGKKQRACSANCRQKLKRLREKRRKEWRDAGTFEAERAARCGSEIIDSLDEENSS